MLSLCVGINTNCLTNVSDHSMDRKTGHAAGLRTTSNARNAATVAATAAAAAVVAAAGECEKKQMSPHL